MPREKPSLAERLRRHNAAFKLALELRCTPAEAEQELQRREARARWEASNARLQAKMNGRPPLPPAPEDQAPPPWMLFD
jgi:hypothetical protein